MTNIKDLLHFDKHGRPRTAEEIADLEADGPITFDEQGQVRTAEEIARIKWARVVERPEVQELLREGLESAFRVYETTIFRKTYVFCDLSGIASRLQDIRCQQDNFPKPVYAANVPELVYH